MLKYTSKHHNDLVMFTSAWSALIPTHCPFKIFFNKKDFQMVSSCTTGLIYSHKKVEIQDSVCLDNISKCARVWWYNAVCYSAPQNDSNVDTPTRARQERVEHHEGSAQPHLETAAWKPPTCFHGNSKTSSQQLELKQQWETRPLPIVMGGTARY